MMETKLSVRQFVDVVNDLLISVYEGVLVEGEVASFKVNHGKYVFFDLKDLRDGTTVNVFMMKSALSVPVEDGMRVVVRGYPKLTNWGRFNLIAVAIQPVGDGNIKKAFEILRARLEAEGIFDVRHKKALPDVRKIKRIGVVSSIAAAGFIDFVKIMNERQGGHRIIVANTVVQGVDAPTFLIRALKRLDVRGDLDVIAIIRGGGSADDLAAFNDEALVRAIFAAKTPVITGIGHEVDVSLADLVADVRSSTPSNAAVNLTFDAKYDIMKSQDMLKQMKNAYLQGVLGLKERNKDKITEIRRILGERIERANVKIKDFGRFFEAVNPMTVLEKGYALVRGEIDVGKTIEIEMRSKMQEMIIKAEVKNVKKF